MANLSHLLLLALLVTFVVYVLCAVAEGGGSQTLNSHERKVIVALIRCEDCGHQVSDQAPTCPQCGRPIAPNTAPPPQMVTRVVKQGSGCGLFFIIVLAIIAAVVMLALL